MALVLADRVQQTGTANTTVSFTLSGSVSGYQSFSVIGNGNTTYYSATDTNGNWEAGIGTYATGGTLTRTTVLASSNSGSAVTFSGTVNVFVTYPSERAVSTDTLAYPPAIGGTTPAAGTFTTLIGGGGSANYGQLTGGSTTNAVQFQTLGSDSNISLAFQPKGTGAIDLAAGSSGVNISNGGTVTAITRTNNGTGYTSFPSISISPPTTAGGVQAVATIGNMFNISATIQAGGTGYTVNDVLTPVGGTSDGVARLTVTSVSGGVITGISTTGFGTYSVLPTNPVSVTGGTGSSATFNLTYGVSTTGLSITNAGSGYVEQPTVSFSGGGGSGAAAYATVGSATTVRGLGSNIIFNTPGGPAFRISDNSITTNGYFAAYGLSSAGQLFSIGSGTGFVGTSSTGSIDLGTNFGTTQMRVSHTASAVNYVQVTGSATGSFPVISAQGSDGTLGLNLYSKGAARINFFNNNGTNRQVSIGGNGATAVNYIGLDGSVSGSSPVVSVAGSDTNIDLTLTPKGTGQVYSTGTAINSQNGLFANNQTISTNYTVAATDNALSAGPVSVAAGVTVTVSSGSVWTVV
jgi:hypothetical protein